jgi:hypothetical protein
MGPLLWKDGYTLYLPGNENSELVPDYYRSELKEVDTDSASSLNESSSTKTRPRVPLLTKRRSRKRRRPP